MFKKSQIVKQFEDHKRNQSQTYPRLKIFLRVNVPLEIWFLERLRTFCKYFQLLGPKITRTIMLCLSSVESNTNTNLCTVVKIPLFTQNLRINQYFQDNFELQDKGCPKIPVLQFFNNINKMHFCNYNWYFGASSSSSSLNLANCILPTPSDNFSMKAWSVIEIGGGMLLTFWGEYDI